MERLRGGLLVKAHESCALLNSRLESNKVTEGGPIWLQSRARGELLRSGDTTPCVKSLRSSHMGLYPVTPVILHGVVSRHFGHPACGYICHSGHRTWGYICHSGHPACGYIFHSGHPACGYVCHSCHPTWGCICHSGHPACGYICHSGHRTRGCILSLR